MKTFLILLSILLMPIASAEIYQVKEVISVYDGDTFTFLIEFVPFDIMVNAKIRLDGVNCPEIRTKDDKEKALGLVAKKFAKDFLAQGEITIDIHKREKFGRYLSDIFVNGKSLSAELISAELGREYHGEKRKGWFDE